MYRLTIRIHSDDTIRLNTNTLFGALFGTEANIRYIPNSYRHKISVNILKLLALQ